MRDTSPLDAIRPDTVFPVAVFQETAAPDAVFQETAAPDADIPLEFAQPQAAERDGEHAGLAGASRAVSGHELVAKLTTDPRMVGWLERALMAALAGAVLTVIAGWRFGLTAAAVVASADAIIRSRTTGVTPATAGMTSAQRRTRWRLARLGPAGYLSLHSRLVPGADTVIDHLVVGPAGVYAIGSERWDRRLPVRASQGGLSGQGTQLFHGPFSQSERLVDIRSKAAKASALISQSLGRKVVVRPAMVIYGPTVPWIVVKIDGVDVFGGRRLRRYLRQEAGANRSHRLSDVEIELAHAAAAQALPPSR